MAAAAEVDAGGPFVPRTGAEVEAFFAPFSLSPPVTAYLRFHAERYAYLMQVVTAAAARPAEILDVGTFLQTELLRRAFPDSLVHTLAQPGPFNGSWGRTRPGETHTVFDLNDAQLPDRVPEMREHDLIVMAEVLEHLYTAPTLVLGAMRSWVRPGGRLVIQTPNAAKLLARVKLLLGRNPYELIRETRDQEAGHFREYTLAELREIAAASGWAVVSAERRSYFAGASRAERAVARLDRIVPPSMRDGITLVLSRPGA